MCENARRILVGRPNSLRHIDIITVDHIPLVNIFQAVYYATIFWHKFCHFHCINDDVLN